MIFGEGLALKIETCEIAIILMTMLIKNFFSRGKLGHVQEEQQLWIIYAYLFYPELYQQLLKNEEIKVKDDEKTSL